MWDTRGQRDPHMALDAGLERLAHAERESACCWCMMPASWDRPCWACGVVCVELAAHWGGTLEAAEGDEVGDLTALTAAPNASRRRLVFGCARCTVSPWQADRSSEERGGLSVVLVRSVVPLHVPWPLGCRAGGLSSRTEPSEEQHAWITDLRRDVDVDWKRLDVTDAAQVEAIAASLVEEGLHGVLHAAGRTQD